MIHVYVGRSLGSSDSRSQGIFHSGLMGALGGWEANDTTKDGGGKRRGLRRAES